MEDYKFLFKVVLVGNAGVGKTCLVRRFTQGLFPPGQGATIGVDFMIKTVEIENEKVKTGKIPKCFKHSIMYSIYNNGEKSELNDYRRISFINTVGKFFTRLIQLRLIEWAENNVIIGEFQLQIWDTAGQERFRSITHSYYRSAHALILVYDISCQPTFDCLPDWLKEIEEYASSKVLRVLVGNKIDRDDREIPTHVGEDFAQRHNMYYLETSAKESDNVENLFVKIATELMEQAKSKELPRYDEINSQNINRRTTSIDVTCCGN